METNILRFKFKGSRDYVHGTDLYNNVANFISHTMMLEEIRNISMKINKVMRKNLIAEIVEPSVSKKSDTTASFAFSLPDGKQKKILLSESDEPVTGRYPYDEDSITRPCTVNKHSKTIILKRRPEFTDIEIIVAMNKALMNSLFPDAPGKWYFTKLEIDKYAERTDFSELKLILVKNLNFRLTKSSVHIDNRLIGYIYFSLAVKMADSVHLIR